MRPQQLVDIVEPAPVPWTPQTVGWLALLAVLLMGVGLLVRAWLLRRAANRYRRDALAELEALQPPTVGAVNAILKRAAMQAYSRPRVAATAGQAWSEFLRASGPAGRLGEEDAALLADGSYSRRGRDGSTLLPFARAWIRHHRAQPPSEG